MLHEPKIIETPVVDPEVRITRGKKKCIFMTLNDETISGSLSISGNCGSRSLATSSMQVIGRNRIRQSIQALERNVRLRTESRQPRVMSLRDHPYEQKHLD